MMSDISCSYHDREAALVAWLYDDIDPADREAFGAHLASCARCRRELDALGGVRRQLARWAPPEPALMSAGHRTIADASNQQPEIGNRQSLWSRGLPAWA